MTDTKHTRWQHNVLAFNMTTLKIFTIDILDEEMMRTSICINHNSPIGILIPIQGLRAPWVYSEMSPSTCQIYPMNQCGRLYTRILTLIGLLQG